jgi:hypothetical protein
MNYRHPVLVLLAFILASCLETSTPLFDVADAVAVPGVTGKWEQADGLGKKTVFLWRDGEKQYRLTQLDERGQRTDYSRVLFVPLAGRTYLMQSQSGASTRASISLLTVEGRHAILHDEMPGELALYARQAGLQVNLLSRQTAPATTKDAIRRFYALYEKGHKGGVPPKIVMRWAGAFRHADGQNYTVASAKTALDANDYARARPALEYLASRGDGEAQYLLAGLFVEPAVSKPLNYDGAVASLLNAQATGFKRATLQLLIMYISGPGAQSYGLFADPGPHPETSKAFDAAASMLGDKDYDAVGRAALDDLAAEECKRISSDAAALAKCTSAVHLRAQTTGDRISAEPFMSGARARVAVELVQIQDKLNKNAQALAKLDAADAERVRREREANAKR